MINKVKTEDAAIAPAAAIKKHRFSNTRFYVTDKDESRIKTIIQTHKNLTEDAKEAVFREITSTVNFYKHKKEWSVNESWVLKGVWNKMPTEQMCDAYQCSHQSLMKQALVLGLVVFDDGKPLDDEDLELILKLVCEEGINPRKAFAMFGLEYNHDETFIVSSENLKSINDYKQTGLFDFEDFGEGDGDGDGEEGYY